MKRKNDTAPDPALKKQKLLLRSPASFGDSFLQTINGQLAQTELLDCVPLINPLYDLQKQYPPQHVFWMHLFTLAFSAKCLEIVQFIRAENLIAEKQIDADLRLFFQLQLAIEANNLPEIARLLPQYFFLEKSEEQSIFLINFLHLFNQNQLLKQNLVLFQNKYPDVYQELWIATYSDYCTVDNLYHQENYLLTCFTVLDEFAKNIAPSFRKTLFLNILKAIFSQEKYTDFILPEKIQLTIVSHCMHKCMIKADHITPTEDHINELLVFFIKHQMHIPLKYLILSQDLFKVRHKVKKIFNLAFEKEDGYLLSFIVKLHSIYLSNTSPELDVSVVAHVFKIHYFALIALEHPEILDKFFNFKQKNHYTFAKLMHRSFISLLEKENYRMLERYLTVSNFLSPDFLLPLFNHLSTQQIQGLFQKFPSIQKVFGKHPNYFELVKDKNCPDLLALVLQKRNPEFVLHVKDYLTFVENCMQEKRYALLKQCVIFENQGLLFAHASLGEIIAELLLELQPKERNAMFLACFLKDAQITVQVFTHIAYNSIKSLHALLLSPFFITYISVDNRQALVHQCCMILGKLPRKSQIFILTALLTNTAFVKIFCHIDDGKIALEKSFKNWQTVLNKHQFTNQKIYDSLYEHLTFLAKNQPQMTSFFTNKLQNEEKQTGTIAFNR